jgi:alpha-tubulin suppressor-like RCC1 family protein
MLSRTAPKAIPKCSRAASTKTNVLNGAGQRVASSQYQARAQRKQRQLYRSLFVVVLAGGAASASQFYQNDGHFLRTAHAEAPPQDDEAAIVFEKSRKKAGVSKEENRDLISSQHLQVKRSWENPGVYAWGSNTGRVVAPDSTESNIKTPRRIAFFDGMLLRDIKLDRNFGAAIDEQGNLLQWGNAYAPDTRAPVRTLQGMNLVSLTLSRDRVLALSKSGKVYSIPVSAEEQASGAKPTQNSWIPLWSSTSNISYRTLTPPKLARSETVTALSGGLEHALLLTSTGRLFSAASASDTYPSRGQLGIPGLSWSTRPEGSFDQPHEITTLNGFQITNIACGDRHSLALDSQGRLFTWGDNTSGQLGFDSSAEASLVDAPSLVPITKPYAGMSQQPRITSIAAGGANSYFTVDATKVAPHRGSANANDPAALRTVGRVTADTFALGAGILGQLGNSRWTHVQATPTRIPSLSGLFEYDEATSTTVPIRLQQLSVGSTHACAIMSNITYTSASSTTSSDDTNWGADVVFWGGNEFFQLGTGRRNNVSTPTYLQPLDAVAEVARARKSTGKKEEHRFHVTPRAEVVVNGRKVEVEQRVECGRGCTAVYSGT